MYGAANCYGCRALGPGDFYLLGRRPLGTARGSRPCRTAAGQPPLPPEGATGQPGRTEQPAAEATTDGEWRVKSLLTTRAAAHDIKTYSAVP